jgi:hypothetical protein
MTKDQFVFEKLKRNGEEWHYRKYMMNATHGWNYPCTCGEVFRTQGTLDYHAEMANHDFTTWEGFGWMWERAKEKYPEFFDSDKRGVFMPIKRADMLQEETQ